MKAVIMAGGEGTRLRPLTSLRPKPMVPIVNQPVMEHILGLVKHHGISEVVATLAVHAAGHRGLLRRRRGVGRRASPTRVEETPLGTAGSVKNAEELLRDETVRRHLRRRADRHRPDGGHRVPQGARAARSRSRSSACPTRSSSAWSSPTRTAASSASSRSPRGARCSRDTINTGIYVVEPRGVRLHPAEAAVRLLRASCSRCSWRRARRCTAACVDGYWCDIGSLGTYMQAHMDVLDGKVEVLHPGRRGRQGRRVGGRGRRRSIPTRTHRRTRSSSATNVKVRAGAEIGEYTVIGDNCVVGHDAQRAPLGRLERHVHRRRRSVCAAPCSAAGSTSAQRATVEHGSRRRRRDDRSAQGAVVGERRAGLPVQAHRARRGRHLARSSGRAGRCARCSARTGVVRPRRRRHHARAGAAARAGVRHDAARAAATSW